MTTYLTLWKSIQRIREEWLDSRGSAGVREHVWVKSNSRNLGDLITTQD